MQAQKKDSWRWPGTARRVDWLLARVFAGAARVLTLIKQKCHIAM